MGDEDGDSQTSYPTDYSMHQELKSAYEIKTEQAPYDLSRFQYPNIYQSLFNNRGVNEMQSQERDISPMNLNVKAERVENEASGEASDNNEATEQQQHQSSYDEILSKNLSLVVAIWDEDSKSRDDYMAGGTLSL